MRWKQILNIIKMPIVLGMVFLLNWRIIGWFNKQFSIGITDTSSFDYAMLCALIEGLFIFLFSFRVLFSIKIENSEDGENYSHVSELGEYIKIQFYFKAKCLFILKILKLLSKITKSYLYIYWDQDWLALKPRKMRIDHDPNKKFFFGEKNNTEGLFIKLDKLNVANEGIKIINEKFVCRARNIQSGGNIAVKFVFLDNFNKFVKVIYWPIRILLFVLFVVGLGKINYSTHRISFEGRGSERYDQQSQVYTSMDGAQASY